MASKIALYNLTTTTKLGGIETCFWELGRALAQRGHAVTIIGGQGEIRKHQGAPNLEVVTGPYRDRHQVIDLGSRFRKLMERASLARFAVPYMIEGKFDAVIMGKPYDIWFALKVRRRAGSRLCYFSGGGEYFPGYAWLTRRLDHFCACSAFDSGHIQQKTGVAAAVNHYGVDSELFRPLPASAELAARHGAEGRSPVLGSAVRLVPAKGLPTALKALALVREQYPQVLYLIAGSGRQETELRRLIPEMGLADHARLVGPLPHAELPGFYALCDLGLFPSLEEPLGIAVGEAMACGLPIAATEVGGIPEQVAPETGRLVPVGDHQALARAILSLLEDREQLAAAGAAARDRIEQHFSWPACAARLEQGLGLA